MLPPCRQSGASGCALEPALRCAGARGPWMGTIGHAGVWRIAPGNATRTCAPSSQGGTGQRCWHSCSSRGAALYWGKSAWPYPRPSTGASRGFQAPARHVPGHALACHVSFFAELAGNTGCAKSWTCRSSVDRSAPKQWRKKGVTSPPRPEEERKSGAT